MTLDSPTSSARVRVLLAEDPAAHLEHLLVQRACARQIAIVLTGARLAGYRSL